MYPRHVAHVITGLIFRGRLGDVFASPLFIAEDFKIQTEIQMGVEKLTIHLRGWWVAGTGRFQNILGLEFVSEERVDFQHGNATVTLDRNERGASFFNPIGARDTEKMPDRIFHVVGIHGLMQLNLLPPVRKAPRVIKRNPALPMMRRY